MAHFSWLRGRQLHLVFRVFRTLILTTSGFRPKHLPVFKISSQELSLNLNINFDKFHTFLHQILTICIHKLNFSMYWIEL